MTTCPAHQPVSRAPRFKVPSGAVDTHFHIFDDRSRLVENRNYTPAPAPQEDYDALQSALGLWRGVVIQPSVYGTDNRTTLAMAQRQNMRAVIVLDEPPNRTQIAELSKQGVVGLRYNALFSGGVAAEDLDRIGAALIGSDWHLQLLINAGTDAELLTHISELPIPIVVDHMGHINARGGVNQLGFQNMLSLLGEGKIWVKLSAPYRLSQDPNFADVLPLVEALVRTNPDQLVWGSDWPHPGLGGPTPDDATLVDLISTWLPRSYDQERVLVSNPERLYGFPKCEAGI